MPPLERRGLYRGLVHAPLGLALAPVDGGHDYLRVDAVAVLQRDVQERVEQAVAQEVRFKAEIEEARVLSVVVVVVLLDARVLDALHPGLDAELVCGVHHQLGELPDRELLGELVEDPHLAALGGVFHGELDAAHRVADVEVAPRLGTVAVNRERVAYGRLYTEAVEDRSEDLLVVEAVYEAPVALALLRDGPVDDALVQVRGPETPDLAGEVDVVGVVDLAEVIPASGLLREGQKVLAAVVLDLDVALFDVYVGLAILSHRAELHQVAVGHVLVYGEEHVQVADDVVVLGVDGVAPVDHRVGRGPLLGEVHDSVRLVALYDLGDELPVQKVAELEPDGLRAHLAPRPNPVLYVRDRGQARGAELVVDRPPDAVVHDDDLMTNVREVQGGRSATVPVATENQYLHYFRSLLLFARSIFFFGIRPHSNRTCQPTIVAEKSPNEYCIGANALFHFSRGRARQIRGSAPGIALTTHRLTYPADAILPQLNAN